MSTIRQDCIKVYLTNQINWWWVVRGMVKWLLLITLLNQTQMGFRRTELVKCEYLQQKRMYWPGCDVLNRFVLKFQCLTCKVESPERMKLLENPSWKLQKMFPNGFSLKTLLILQEQQEGLIRMKQRCVIKYSGDELIYKSKIEFISSFITY